MKVWWKVSPSTRCVGTPAASSVCPLTEIQGPILVTFSMSTKPLKTILPWHMQLCINNWNTTVLWTC